MYVRHMLHPLIHQRAPRLRPCPGHWSRGDGHAVTHLFQLVLLFPLDKYPELELLDHMVVLFLIQDP